MKKMCVILISLLMITTLAFPAAADSSVMDKTFFAVEDLGEPIETCQPLDSIVQEVNGVDYLYSTSSGAPAIFNVFNLDTQQYVKSYELTGSKSAWVHVKDSKGKIYIAADAIIFCYDPYIDTFDALGKYLSSESASFAMTIDENDNLYIGTFPNAKLVKYSSSTKTFTDLGVVEDGASYVRSLTYHNGYLYCGTYGNGSPKFIRVSTANPTMKTRYSLPTFSYLNNANFEWLYSMNMVGSYAVIYTKSAAATPMLVFDTNSEQFVDIRFSLSFKGLYTTQLLSTKAYFISTNKMYEIDTSSGFQINDISFPLYSGAALFGGGWVTISGNSQFPGKSYCTINQENGDPVLFNMQTKQSMSISNHGQRGGKITLQAIEKGPGNTIYAGGYMGHQGTVFDPSTDTFKTFPIGQTEGMIQYNGKMYFGIYTRAGLYEFDPALPAGSTNPKLLAQVGESQDRPFAMTALNNRIYMGTIPDYGQLGGALAVYDLSAKKMTAYRNIVPNQSVMSLTEKDGLIYGSTTVYGGLGSTPSAQQAKIFAFDPAQNAKIDEFAVSIPGITNPLWIGSISFGQDGLLWGVTGNTLFALDTATKQTVKNKTFADYTYDPNIHQWRPTYIHWGSDGYLYTNIDGIKIVDTASLQFKDLKPLTGKTGLFTLDADDNIYFATTSHLKRMRNDTKGTQIAEFDRTVAQSGIETIPLPNGSFEQGGDPIPGWDPMGAFAENCSAFISTENSFKGSSSLKIIDTLTTAQTGYISGYIPVDSSFDYTLFHTVYLKSGRTCITVYTYDQNYRALSKIYNNLQLPAGSWLIVSTKLQVPALTKYIKIQFYTSEYWMSESFYDDAVLVKQTKH